MTLSLPNRQADNKPTDTQVTKQTMTKTYKRKPRRTSNNPCMHRNQTNKQRNKHSFLLSTRTVTFPYKSAGQPADTVSLRRAPRSTASKQSTHACKVPHHVRPRETEKKVPKTKFQQQRQMIKGTIAFEYEGARPPTPSIIIIIFLGPGLEK